MEALAKTAGVLVVCILSALFNHSVLGASAQAAAFGIPFALSLIALHRTFQGPRP